MTMMLLHFILLFQIHKLQINGLLQVFDCAMLSDSPSWASVRFVPYAAAVQKDAARHSVWSAKLRMSESVIASVCALAPKQLTKAMRATAAKA